MGQQNRTLGAYLLTMLIAACAVVWSAPARAVAVIERAQLTLALHGGASTHAQPQAVTLPFHWDQRQGAVDGEARFAFDVPVTDPAAPLALFVPRLGNSFRISVNGRALAGFGAFPPGPYDDASFAPQYFVVPPPGSAEPLHVEVTIAAQAARQGGLSVLVTGREDEVRPLYERAEFWHVSGGRFIAIASGVLGALSLLVWLRQRESIYLYYGLGELLWTVQTTRVLFTHAPLPWPWWGVLPLAAFQAAVPLLCRFALAVVGHDDGRLARFLGVMAWSALPAAALGIMVPWLWLMPAWQALNLVVGLGMATLVLRAALRSTMLEHRVLATAVVMIVLCGARDIWVMRTSPEAYAVVPWFRFAWVGFGISLGWVIAERMRKDASAVAAVNASLEGEKARGAIEERRRLVRDLHDGLGGQLVGLLRMAQQPGTDREEVALHLRDAVDQLKLTVDAMHGDEGDVASALGAVRYRLGPRLQAAGIDLHWDVSPLPPIAGWNVRESHELQMLLFEAFANTAAHSGATRASLCARLAREGGTADEAIEIELRDNGRGFDTDATFSGKGLANMRARAVALGGVLTLRSQPGESCLRLRLRTAAMA